MKNRQFIVLLVVIICCFTALYLKQQHNSELLLKIYGDISYTADTVHTIDNNIVNMDSRIWSKIGD